MKKYQNRAYGLLLTPLLCMVFLFSATTVQAQQPVVPGNYITLEMLQDQNMDYMEQLAEITSQYPLFSYSYQTKDGEITDVEVTGIDNEVDTKKIELVLLNLKSNKNKLKSSANRMGVFYGVDQEPMYKHGGKALNDALQKQLKYPAQAKNWGVEGTIYLEFVVDENGKIPYITTNSHGLNTDQEFYISEMEKQAVSAIQSTSGDWIPGEINDVAVSSFVVVPITFDLKQSPWIPFTIR